MQQHVVSEPATADDQASGCEHSPVSEPPSTSASPISAMTAAAPPVASAPPGGLIDRPELFARLARAGRVTVVSAPAGSGKTSLVRSWICHAGQAESVAWVCVEPEERDPQQFWIAVLEALCRTKVAANAVRRVTPAPSLDGWAIVERLLEDLGSLTDPLWLVVDDLHQLKARDAVRQLQLLVLRSPRQLRFVLLSRAEVRLGLHRLRLDGELTEIGADDLRFSLDQARELFAAAGIQLSDRAVARLHERTEGWAAGLRLAALSLAQQPDPERFAAEFSGSERGVAEYLLAEVLEHQPEHVRRLLLRTSILERVNGPLADLLTGDSGDERTLQALERMGALVSLDARRSWFRYHQLLADALQFELRRTSPGEVRGLHMAAAQWYAEHDYPIEAVRHAQAAENWYLAARLLADQWVGLQLSGRRATAHALLAAFPAGVVTTDAELAAMASADELFFLGSLEKSAGDLALAARGSDSLPVDRRLRLEVWLTVLRLFLASSRGNLPAAVEDAQRLLTPGDGSRTSQPGPFDDYRTLALIALGEAELTTFRLDGGERHLKQALTLARARDLPFLEVTALADLAHLAALRSAYVRGAQWSIEAIRVAERHGWTDQPVAGSAYGVLGATTLMQGRLDEAQAWLTRAERALRGEARPVVGAHLHIVRALLELARGRNADALAALRASERLAQPVVECELLTARARSLVLYTLVRMHQTDRVEALLAEMAETERETAEMRTALAALRLAEDDPEAATVALAPVLDGSVAPWARDLWLATALLLEASARAALKDRGAAEVALERALEIAEPDGLVLPFMLHPVAELLHEHRRNRTSHAALVADILAVLGGEQPAARPDDTEPLREPLSDSETRVLRYLPTNLSAPEIANELYVAPTTVKTHIQHIYAKLGVHRRADAVERARALGLLAPARSAPKAHAPASSSGDLTEPSLPVSAV